MTAFENSLIYHIQKCGIRTDKEIQDASNFDFRRELIYLILTKQHFVMNVPIIMIIKFKKMERY